MWNVHDDCTCAQVCTWTPQHQQNCVSGQGTQFPCCPTKDPHLDICEHTLIATCGVFSNTSCTSLESRCYVLHVSVPWLLSPTLQTDPWDSSHLFYSWLFPFFHPPTLPNVHTISLPWNHSWFVHWWSCAAALMSLKISLKARSQ